jgi:hypothetical protein
MVGVIFHMGGMICGRHGFCKRKTPQQYISATKWKKSAADKWREEFIDT